MGDDGVSMVQTGRDHVRLVVENLPDEEIGALLKRARRIAVVGLSTNPSRSSHAVAGYLRRHGYTIVPVNPNYDSVFGERSYSSLEDVPGPIDIVDVFRRADAVYAVAEAAVHVGAGALWLQEGVINPVAAARARSGG